MLFRKLLFRLRWHDLPNLRSAARRAYWKLLGLPIGSGTRVGSIQVTWPHRVFIANNCSLENGVYLKASGGYSDQVSIHIGEGCFLGTGCEINALRRIELGANCLIASGTRFIDHNHGTQLGKLMKEQPEESADIVLGSDVWVGANSVILKGVTIGSGAIVAAGSVVTKSVDPLTIVGGVPARVIRVRS